MVKEIKYTGFTASPSDYECPDGDLAAVLNVVPEEGSLSPVMPPRRLFQLDDGGYVRFVHHTAYIRNFIILHPDNTITWRTQDDPDQYSHGTLPHSFTGRTIHQINAIGNTLLVLADDGMHYFLWKGYRNGTEQESDHKEYLYLGNHIPELDMSFGLDLASEYKGDNGVYLTKNDYPRYEAAHGGRIEIGNISVLREEQDFTFFELRDDHIKEVQDMLLGAANSVIAKASDLGYFCMPFLVRYAYRLYDGQTLCMHSSPVLMMASGGVPFAYSRLSGNTAYDFYAGAYFFRLDYAVKASIVEKLAYWNDIIKSVDIFVSAPIYKYDQNAREWDRTYSGVRYWNLYDYKRSSNEFLSFDRSNFFVSNNHELSYSQTNVIEDFPYKKRYASSFRDVPSIIHLPQRKEKDFIDDVKHCSSFYLLKSIDINDLKSTRTLINIDRGYLSNIAAMKVMTDDYDSHDTIIPKYSYGYNARLNLIDIRKCLFGGFNPCRLFNFTDYDDESYSPTSSILVTVFFFIMQDNKEFVVSGGSATFAANTPFAYLYYPNSHAYKAVISVNSKGITKLYELPMNIHEKLNGACFFGGYDFDLYDGTHDYSGSYPSVTPESDRFIEIPNKIYTSEVNNPYFFPVSYISTVGVGHIMSICSSAKALSQGQFGQHPIYAFTDEGVWAISISETGTLVPAQPFTRDVCINPDSITQLDSSVLFATDRGLMLISGSSSICISDSLDYTQPFRTASLPNFDKLLSFSVFASSDLSYVTFREFVRGCRELYSYIQQRIIVFNRDYPYAYVYSLKSRSWGMMPSTIALAIPSYPEAIAQMADGSIVDYSATADPEQATRGIKGVIITRPLKLDAPDVLKTVDTVVQRGNFQRGHVKSALFGSRDLVNWFIVWTSQDHYMRGFRGTPYKYYRIIVLCDLDPTESIYGCSIEYTPRYTDRLR